MAMDDDGKDTMRLMQKSGKTLEKPEMIVRRGLIDRMLAAKGAKLILVSAPAGSGKTTLVSQWLAECGSPAARYFVDGSEDDPEIFFRRLLRELESINPDFEKSFAPMINSVRLPPGREIISFVINRLVTLSKAHYIVLEDYHFIRSREIAESVHYLLRHIPPLSSLVVVTRDDPRLPMSRFRATGEMLELRSGDLNFSPEESASYFEAFAPAGLGERHMERLHEKMEGWITGLRLAVVSLRGGENLDRFVDAFGGESRLVVDYLAEEALRTLPQAHRDFLLKTSILRRFNAELSSAIAGTGNAFDLLGEIDRANLFLVSLDQNRTWYRYRPFFAELLQYRLTASFPELSASLHKRACLWFGKKGDFEEAQFHAFAASDDGFSADRLEEYGFTLIGDHKTYVVRRWLSALPEAVCRERFLLQIQKLWIEVVVEKIAEPFYELQRLEAGFHSMTQGYCPERKRLSLDYLSAMRLFLLRLSHRFDRVVQEAPDAVRAMSYASSLARGLGHLAHALCLFDMGEATRSVQPFEDAQKEMRSIGSGYGVTTISRYRAWIERVAGGLRHSQKMVEDSLAAIDASKFSVHPSTMELYMESARILYELNDLDRSAEQVDRCVALAEIAGDLGSLTRGLLIRSFIFQANGRPAAARRSMDRALALARRMSSPVAEALSAAEEVHLCLLQGKSDIPERWEKKRKLDSEEPFSRCFEYECMAQARVFLSRHQYRKAAALLGRLASRSEKRGRKDSVIKIRVLQAGAIFGEGLREEALGALDEAVALAMPEGYVRPFADCAEYIRKPLQLLRRAKRGRLREYAGELLEAFERGPKCTAGKDLPPERGADPLTPREMEVLELMASGHSNRHIAESAFVSLNTIKTHVRNIYGKLGVRNRAQAISVAGGILKKTGNP